MPPLFKNRYFLGIATALAATSIFHAYVQFVVAGAIDELSPLSEYSVPGIQNSLHAANSLTAALWFYLYSLVFSLLCAYLLHSWHQRNVLFIGILALTAGAIPLAIDHSSAANANGWAAMSAAFTNTLPVAKWYRPGGANPGQGEKVDAGKYSKDELFQAIAELEEGSSAGKYTEPQALFVFHAISSAFYIRTGEKPSISLGSVTHTFAPEPGEARTRVLQIVAVTARRANSGFRWMWVALLIGLVMIAKSLGNKRTPELLDCGITNFLEEK